MTDKDLKLSIDVTEAKAFLESVEEAARAQFAICRAGDVIFIECDFPTTVEQQDKLADRMKLHLAGTGVRGVFLGKGMRVARINLENPEKT